MQFAYAFTAFDFATTAFHRATMQSKHKNLI